ncbi:MAG: zf-TFIIB domain-containing protein [Thermodesulfobacteriota bacterium]
MKCPVCTEVDLLLSERQGVEIDYCPKCRGVWLDRGELDKIVAATTGQAEQGRPHGHGAGASHHHQHYKKKSLLHELFDF